MKQKRKRTDEDVICTRFYCDAYGDRYCCHYCKKPCGKQCRNDPEKCGLVEDPTSKEEPQ